MATIYNLVTFADIVSAVKEELGVDQNDSKITNRIKRDINTIYLNEVVPEKRWPWLKRSAEVQVPVYFSTGTAAVTASSTAVTLTESPAISYKGAKFSVVGFNEVYSVEQHAANSNTLTLESKYTGTGNTAASFKIWWDMLPMPADCSETIEVTHDFKDRPLDGCGPQEFARLQSTGKKVEGRPAAYSTGAVVDPTSYEAISGLPATATRSSSGLIRSVVFASTLGADADSADIIVGDKLEISGAGNQDYNGEIQVIALGTTAVANDTLSYLGKEKKTETSTADTGMTIKKLDPSPRNEEYLEFYVHPAISDTATTLHVEYKVRPRPLENDGDEPLIPLGDRVVLLYGALSRQWVKSRDEETASLNVGFYGRKLAKMAGKLKDTSDSATLTVNRRYMANKRRMGESSRGLSSTFGGGFGPGGGASTVLGTASRVTVFNSDGKVSSSDITTTELDYLDGVTSNLQTQLDAKLAGQGTVVDNTIARWNGTDGTSLDDSGVAISDLDAVTGVTALDVDNIKIDGNSITSTDTNGDITLTPNGTGTVVASKVDITDGIIETGVQIVDPTDNTKAVQLTLDGATTAKTLTLDSNHTDDRTLTLPDATDTLVGKATTDTLTNKTLTSAVLNTGVSGTAVLDEDNLASDSDTQVATQQSIKAYVDAIPGADASGSQLILATQVFS